jgi:hypothetical protein
MDLSRLQAIQDKKAQEAKEQALASKQSLSNLELQETIVRVAKSIVEFIEGNTTKTVVLNQIQDFATHEDAETFVQSIDNLHDTLKTHENTDISPLTEVLKDQLEQIKQLPKEFPKTITPDMSERFESLEQTVKAVEQAIKAQELKVEAPVVNVPQAKITVPRPEVKIVKETTEVTNEITVQDWRKEYVMSDSRKSPNISYYGHLKTDGSWYIMRHRTSEDEDDFTEDWDQIRYVFGDKGYPAAFKGREKLKYKYLSEARNE